MITLSKVYVGMSLDTTAPTPLFHFDPLLKDDLQSG